MKIMFASIGEFFEESYAEVGQEEQVSFDTTVAIDKGFHPRKIITCTIIVKFLHVPLLV